MSLMYYCSTWICCVISTLHKLLSKILVVCYHESLISLGWLSWSPAFQSDVWRSVLFIYRLCTLKNDRLWLDTGWSLTVSSQIFFLTVHSPDSEILLEHFRSKLLLISWKFSRIKNRYDHLEWGSVVVCHSEEYFRGQKHWYYKMIVQRIRYYPFMS